MPPHNPDLPPVTWRKSSRSSSEGQNCVEVTASKSGFITVRDSKNCSGPKLIFTDLEWTVFLQEVKYSESKSD